MRNEGARSRLAKKRGDRRPLCALPARQRSLSILVPRTRPPPHLHAAECAVAQPGRVRVRRVGWTRARADPRRLVAQLLAAAARGQEDSERGNLRGGAAAAAAVAAIATAAERASASPAGVCTTASCVTGRTLRYSM